MRRGSHSSHRRSMPAQPGAQGTPGPSTKQTIIIKSIRFLESGSRGLYFEEAPSPPFECGVLINDDCSLLKVNYVNFILCLHLNPRGLRVPL